MIVDIFTKQVFSEEEFKKNFKYLATYDLLKGRSQHYLSRYILEENWNNLVIVLTDSEGNIYNYVKSNSMEFYFGKLSPIERKRLALVANNQAFSCTLKDIKIFKKEPLLDVVAASRAKANSKRDKEKRRLSSKIYNSDPDRKKKNSKNAKEWFENNKERALSYRREYWKSRQSNDLNCKLRKRLRSRMYKAVKGNYKSGSTLDLVGCDIGFLKEYLASLFLPEMSWENYGLWHIDHIIPCASFDLSDPKQQQKCFHYSNLQPLWAKDNILKSDKTV